MPTWPSSNDTSTPLIPHYPTDAVDKAPGAVKRHPTHAGLVEHVAEERVRIAAGGGILFHNEHLFTETEPTGVYRRWHRDTAGANAAARAAASHARFAVIYGRVFELPGDANTVTPVAGLPAGGIDGNLCFDRDDRVVWQRTSGVWIVLYAEGLLFQASRAGNVNLGQADLDSVVRMTGTGSAVMPDLGQRFGAIKVERVAGGGGTTPVADGVDLVPRHTGALAPITNDGAFIRIEPSGTAGKYYVTRVGN